MLLVAGAVVVIVIVVVPATLPLGVTLAGEKLHAAWAGNPEQAKVVGWLNPLAGVTLIGELLTAHPDEMIPHLEVTMVLQPATPDPEQHRRLMDEEIERIRAFRESEGETSAQVTDGLVISQVQRAYELQGVCIRWLVDV